MREGTHHSPESKEKLRRANLGKRLSEEHKKKIGLKSLGNSYNKGKRPSEETKEKIRQAHLGKHHSLEARARMKIAQNRPNVKEKNRLAQTGNKHRLGIKHDAESKKKMSQAHIGRTPWNKGKKGIFSSETIEKIRKSSRGRLWSTERKEKLSQYKLHQSEETKKKISQKISQSLTGKKHSPETIEKLKTASRLRWQDPNEHEKDRQSRLKRVFPAKDTKIEVALQTELSSRGITYQTHQPLYCCQPDILIPERKIAIFADGCYWHGCSDCHMNKNRPNQRFQAEKAIEKDIRQTETQKNLGYTVLRFWEHDIKKDVKGCVDQIVEAMSSTVSQ
jgi:DNA mismatch endonuclease (patch repair protein)